jgi:hypothetical protein
MKNLSLLTIMLAFIAFSITTFAQADQKGQAFNNVEFILEWDVASTANTPGFRAEYYSVWISTNGTNPENFVMIFDETLSTAIPNWQYQPREVDITNFGGAIIHVAFRHHDITDKDRIVIDNVKISMRDSSRDGMDEILLFEDFQEGIADPVDEEWMPDGWTKLDADEDGFNWYFQVRQGEGAMRSQSWDGDEGPLTPDNWLFTPAIHLEYVGLSDLQNVTYSLYPNPANGNVTIKAGTTINQVLITDLRGRVLYYETINSSSIQLSTGDFEAGLYIVRIFTDKGVADTKLQVVR